jgi:hypothetical protein
MGDLMARFGDTHALIVNTGPFQPRIVISLAAREKRVTGTFKVGFRPMAKTGR